MTENSVLFGEISNTGSTELHTAILHSCAFFAKFFYLLSLRDPWGACLWLPHLPYLLIYNLFPSCCQCQGAGQSFLKGWVLQLGNKVDHEVHMMNDTNENNFDILEYNRKYILSSILFWEPSIFLKEFHLFWYFNF